MICYKKIFFICVLCCCQVCYAGEKTLIRLGVLARGTVNWELESMKGAGLMDTENYRLEVTKFAVPQSGKMALRTGKVDMIVADWVWVSHQRSLGKDYTFYPYSNTTGALVVAKGSSIQQLSDLKNKKVAMAGGELDKNSLLLRALLTKQGQGSVFNSMKKVYGAPPLLIPEMKSKRVDALLTYWHYAARMEAEGYTVLMTGADILQRLGIKYKVPSIGYVFSEQWAQHNQSAIQAFLKQTKRIKNALCEDDSAWQGIQPLIHAKTDKEDQLLRGGYCRGRILSWGEKEQQAAAEIYQLLKASSHKRLTGKAEVLVPGTFWIP